MSIDISLLPRADLPVIWEEFKTKANAVRRIAETLTVTSVAQKEDMAIARKVRLTLREIRIAVEHKRVELGEGHLKEIQKVNGAAKALREFIEPLEARLLMQESFAERAEEKRIGELGVFRCNELFALSPRVIVKDVGTMSQESYDGLIATLRAEQADREAANRLRVEAESRLAAQKLEMELREVAIREENNRRNDEAERVRAEQEAKHRAELSAVSAQRALEREAERIKWAQEVAETEAKQRELKRIQEEQLTALATELAKERAAKQAEADAARKLSLAPDIEKLLAFAAYLREIRTPQVSSVLCQLLMDDASSELIEAAARIETFCERNLTTK